MKLFHALRALALVGLCVSASMAQEKNTLVDLTSADAVSKQVTPNEKLGDTTFTATDKGLEIGIVAGGKAGFPGVVFKPPEGAAFDLSAFGHVEAKITNNGEKRVYINVRVDNEGDHNQKPWSVEARVINPGRTETIKVLFGRSYGFKETYKLDPSKINNILIFSGKSDVPQKLLIESLTAGGTPGEAPAVNPEHVRIVPPEGVIFGASTDVAKEMKITSNGAKTRIDGGAIELSFTDTQRAILRPAVGRWNLRDHLQVQVTLKNTGDAPASPRVNVESNDGPTEVITADPIAPGASATITVPFMASVTWQGPTNWETKPFNSQGGTKFASNVVSGIAIEADAGASLRIESIVANMPPAQPLPEWVGKRPPIEGDWKMTFEENFDAPLDFGRWNIYTANFWDKKSRFSKENVIVEDGVAKLRFEKKTGPHNDSPEGRVNDYTTGYLGTYGKWTQRYGYFEARMKLPEAPGMWPAFWMMPDRGRDAGPQWKRASTNDKGMEFDIMEYLSRWGPNRFTIAFHWDGYEKNHKATGTAVYVAPDKDGYITSGLLWLPGQVVVYHNGREYARWEGDRIPDMPMYLIFTAVSGGWDNDPIDDAKLPSDFVIDYVRAYQRADLASDVDGPKPNDGTPLAQ